MVKNKNFLLKLIFLISFLALIAAFFIEYILGFQPCNLCLFERIPYFFALIIILLNYKFHNYEKKLVFLLIVIFVISTILSLYHLGIEQDLIKESFVCDIKNSSNLITKEEILKQLNQRNISCKDVTFKIFGFSLTSYNIVISLFLTYISLNIYLNNDKN